MNCVIFGSICFQKKDEMFHPFLKHGKSTLSFFTLKKEVLNGHYRFIDYRDDFSHQFSIDANTVDRKSNPLITAIAIFLFCTQSLCAQPWIPQLNANGTYTLVSEDGKPIFEDEYNAVAPLWDNSLYISWHKENKAGCIFPNKTSITIEGYKGIGERSLKTVAFQNQTEVNLLPDLVYLFGFSKHKLLVNIQTGKYLEDNPDSRDVGKIIVARSLIQRHGWFKIRSSDGWVNFADTNLKMLFPHPLKNGEVVASDLFIAEDTSSKKMGLVNTNGIVVTPFIYGKLFVTPTEKHVLAYTPRTIDGHTTQKIGLLDTHGKLVLDTIYDEITVFGRNFYVLRIGDMRGVIDLDLKFVVAMEQQRIEKTDSNYPETLQFLFILTYQNNKPANETFTMMDTNGKIVLQAQANDFNYQPWCEFLDLEQGTETTVYSTRNGIHLSYKGPSVRTLCYDTGVVSDSFLIRNENKVQIYRRNGQKVNEYPFYYVLPLKSTPGFYCAHDAKQDKDGVISPAGDTIAAIQYDAIYDTTIEYPNKHICVLRTGTIRQYGIYDQSKKKWVLFSSGKKAADYVFPPEFEIKIGKNQLYSVITTNDKKTVIPEQYQFIQQIPKSTLFICIDHMQKKWFIIDKNNQVVFSFDHTPKQKTPLAHILESTGNLAIQYGDRTVFLEKNTYKILSIFPMMYVNGICLTSQEHSGWVSLYRPDDVQQKCIWVNYYTGKIYLK